MPPSRYYAGVLNMKKKDIKEKAKMEAAAELGLADKVRKLGWGNLTSKETGRVGALMRGRNKNGKSDGGNAP
jgi:small acid-soluble spore protein F (minor alpha/beta-type SASP)